MYLNLHSIKSVQGTLEMGVSPTTNSSVCESPWVVERKVIIKNDTQWGVHNV